MPSKATTVKDYLAQLPEERVESFTKLKETIAKSIPKGYEETISYGMIGYVVPHKLFPAGYHCDPKLPLPFVTVASQKNFIAVHHMGLYASPKLLE